MAIPESSASGNQSCTKSGVPPTGRIKVGILGGGQLGRMLALAGHPLDVEVFTFDTTPDACSREVCKLSVGSYTDREAIAEFCSHISVCSYEFENVLLDCATQVAELVPLYPGLDALRYSQDRLLEKELFKELGIPTVKFVQAHDTPSLLNALNEVGFPAIIKTRREGYDGKGQLLVSSKEEWQEIAPRVSSKIGSGPWIVEQCVNFTRELSIIAVRSLSGDTAFYPLNENVHSGGILQSSTPYLGQLELTAGAHSYALKLLQKLNYVGVMTLELFEVAGSLLANEFAPRVHNSGHWTIEGAVTSQFENHLRAICGFPLGSTERRENFAMYNIIGAIPPVDQILKIEGAHLHLYGKDPKPGRKLGHVTVISPDKTSLAARSRLVMKLLGIEC